MCHSLAGRVPAGLGVFTRNQRAQSEMGEKKDERGNLPDYSDAKEEKHYQPAGFGLQLQVLWNRNHMRGVFDKKKKRKKNTR